MWQGGTKWANAAVRKVELIDFWDMGWCKPSVYKNSMTAECNNMKFNKTRYACLFITDNPTKNGRRLGQAFDKKMIPHWQTSSKKVPNTVGYQKMIRLLSAPKWLKDWKFRMLAGMRCNWGSHSLLLLLLLSRFSHVRLWDSKKEYWSGLPFPSPMHASEKWKWSRSVVSNSSWPHGLQPTRLLRPWDFPGKSAGVSCHCLLCWFIARESPNWHNHWKTDNIF